MTWRIQLIQTSPSDVPRWFTGRALPNWQNGLTAMAKRAATYSTEQGAKDAAANLPKHSWGTWEAREVK